MRRLAVALFVWRYPRRQRSRVTQRATAFRREEASGQLGRSLLLVVHSDSDPVTPAYAPERSSHRSPRVPFSHLCGAVVRTGATMTGNRPLRVPRDLTPASET